MRPNSEQAYIRNQWGKRDADPETGKTCSPKTWKKPELPLPYGPLWKGWLPSLTKTGGAVDPGATGMHGGEPCQNQCPLRAWLLGTCIHGAPGSTDQHLVHQHVLHRGWHAPQLVTLYEHCWLLCFSHCFHHICSLSGLSLSIYISTVFNPPSFISWSWTGTLL